MNGSPKYSGSFVGSFSATIPMTIQCRNVANKDIPTTENNDKSTHLNVLHHLHLPLLDFTSTSPLSFVPCGGSLIHPTLTVLVLVSI